MRTARPRRENMPKTALHAVQSPEAQVPDTSETVFHVIRNARDTFDESMKAAFEYGGGRDPEDTQKALHAIAYLMEWATGAGNEQVSPMAFNGLSYLVHKCARDVGRL